MKSGNIVSNLKRITSEYIELEDRIRLAGLTDENQTISIWLTMRLLRRLITHCLNLLEKNTPELKKTPAQNEYSRKSVQHFVQKSAEQQIVEEAAVKVADDSPNQLPTEIDIKNDDAGVTIIFKGEFSSDYAIYLNNQQLRQWLGMLHMIWQKAEWPNLVWPDWMSGSAAETSTDENSIH